MGDVDIRWLTALAALIAASTALVTFFVGRHDKKKDPIPRTQAELALTVENLGILRTINDGVVNELRRVEEARQEDRDEHTREMAQIRADLEETRRVARSHERQIAELQDGLANIKGLFGKATQFIEELLRYIAGQQPGQGEDMPELPASLHAFIDPQLHNWPATRPSSD